MNDLPHRPLLKKKRREIPEKFQAKATQEHILWLNSKKKFQIIFSLYADKCQNPFVQIHVPGSKHRYPCTQSAGGGPRISRHSDPISLLIWSDYSKQVGGKFLRVCLKIAKKCWLCLDIFSCVKMNVFACFSLSDSRCMSDAITSSKLEQTGKIFWDSRCCLSAWVSAFWAQCIKVKWGVTLFMCWL